MSEGVDMTEAPAHDELAVNITEHEINTVMLNPEVCTDLNSNNEPPILATVAVQTILQLEPVEEIQQSGVEGEEGQAMETSGRGIRKRPPRQFGALDSCLCGMVMKPGAERSNVGNLVMKLKLLGMFDYNHVDQDDLHII